MWAGGPTRVVTVLGTLAALVLVVPACGGASAAAPAVSAAARSPTPRIRLSPATAPAGARVRVLGSGFSPRARGALRFARRRLAGVAAGPHGGLRAAFRVPRHAPGKAIVSVTLRSRAGRPEAARAALAVAVRARPSSARPCGFGAGARLRRYDHIVWVVMENHGYDQVVSAPYLRRLGRRCGLATNFHAETHPSLGNYIAMVSGSDHGIHDDDPPPDHRLTGPSIFTQRLTSRTLSEDMASNCSEESSGGYRVKHNPEAYFTRAARHCRRYNVPLRARPDLSAQFTLIVPNQCHDMHDCPVATGDAYLSTLVPKLLDSRQYRAGRTAVFITWDEDDGATENRIATYVLAPGVRPGRKDPTGYTHYSMLRTTEELLGVPLLGGARRAASMRAGLGL